jgi:chromate reductase, NAD(P)H dehydrogenase (quinone)
MTRLLGICGSLRRDSLNRRLLAEAARMMAADDYREADLVMPLFNEELEVEGRLPDATEKFVEDLRWADAVIMATPEYNKSFSGSLKNALDWMSRAKGSPMRDKPLAIMSASDGRSGGERAQFALRLALVSFRPRMVPGPEVLLAYAQKAFDDNGHLSDERAIRNLTEVVAQLKSYI